MDGRSRAAYLTNDNNELVGVENFATAATSGGGATLYFNETPSGTIDGVNLTFTLAHTPTVEPILFLGPMRLLLGIHYTRSGATITFVSGYQPRTGELLSADYA